MDIEKFEQAKKLEAWIKDLENCIRTLDRMEEGYKVIIKHPSRASEDVELPAGIVNKREVLYNLKGQLGSARREFESL